MADVEQNLDAYRILSEILQDLRNVLHAELEGRHGNEWYRVGLPEAVRQRLIERKEREKAIDWYENEYQQLIDFASFADILEILDVNPDLVPQLKAVTPSQPLLHARMMELEVMREKLAMARAISESELSFLGTFHMRIRKALDGPAPPPRRSEEKPALQAVPQPEKKADDENTPEKKAKGEVKPEEDDGGQDEAPKKKSTRPKMKTRIGRSRTFGGSASSTTPAPAAAQTTLVTEEELDEPEPEPKEAQEASGNANALAVALDEGDNTTVLRALYKEVTGLAEGIWNSDPELTPAVWPRVREHTWYEESFSKLGLKPLSDFFEILVRIREQVNSGLSKDDLQRFLKEQNFAKVLLALRDMFQKNDI